MQASVGSNPTPSAMIFIMIGCVMKIDKNVVEESVLYVFIRDYENGKKLRDVEMFSSRGKKALRECKNVLKALVEACIKDGFELVNRTEETATVRRGLERREIYICEDSL